MEPNQQQPPPYSPPTYGPPGTVVTGPTMMVPTTMIISQSAFMTPSPTVMICPSCRAQMVTRVESSPSIRTHVIAAILCLFVFWPCVCVPYCTGSCNNADHYCPSCNAYIGSYKF